MIDITDKSAVVREIQQFLYELSVKWDFMPSVAVDGIYGSETEEAVRIFQRRFELPVTGEVDFTTWNLLSETAGNSLEERGTIATPPVPEGTFPLRIGSRGSPVVLLRTSLNELSAFYPALPFQAPTSLYQYGTARAVEILQGIYRLSPTGTVDLFLWNFLHEDLDSKYRSRRDIAARNAPFPLIS